VKVVFAIFAVVLMAPLLLVVAIALGPVAVGILCAVGFGLIIFVVVNFVIGLVVLVERAGWRYTHHARVPSLHT
jgi:hypothetical protein